VAKVVLIAGLSGSGKTTLARSLCGCHDAVYVGIDHYYHGFEDVPLAQRQLLNFDSPDSIEHERLIEDVVKLKQGLRAMRPTYDHAAFARLPEPHPLDPRPLIVVEGMFALYWSELRAVADCSVFVDTHPETCLRRRLHRDLHDFKRSAEDALLRYHSHVKPNQERYVLPGRSLSDLQLDGERDVAELVRAVRSHLTLSERSSSNRTRS